MISKHLTIAAAIVLISGLGFGPAVAQTAPAAPTMAAPGGAAPAAAPAGGTMAPAAAPAAAAPAAPAVTPPSASAAAPTENPYGLGDIVAKKNPVSMTMLGILGVMSIGTWYIFFMKYFEQGRILSQARTRREALLDLGHAERRHRQAAEELDVPRDRRSRRPRRPRAAPPSSVSTTGSPCR